MRAHVPVVLDAEDEADADEPRRGQHVVVALQGVLVEDAHLHLQCPCQHSSSPAIPAECVSMDNAGLTAGIHRSALAGNARPELTCVFQLLLPTLQHAAYSTAELHITRTS